MKIPIQRNSRQGKDGMATIMFITLLTIMVLLATAESAALIRLHREVKFVEQQQIKRLTEPQNHSAPAAPAIINSNSK
jgi:hypothetical protein